MSAEGRALDSVGMRRLANANPDGTFAVDLALRLTFCNATLARLTGRAEADVVGRSVFEVLPFLDNPRDRRDLAVVLSDGKNGPLADAPARAAERPPPWDQYDTRFGPVRGDDGCVTGALVTLRDDSDRRRAEQSLAETEARFRNMADHSPVLLWMSRADGFCTFFNQTWLQFTGRSLEEEWGVGWAEGVHPEDFQHCMDVYTQAFGTRQVFEMEYRLRRADGAYRWILDRGAPRYVPGGEFAGYIGSCVDITDRKQLEDELRKAVQAREDFLSIASHELRTPITALLVQLESAERAAHRDVLEPAALLERVLRVCHSARGQGERLAALLGTLLDVSRLLSGKVVLQLEALDLADVARDQVERTHQIAEKARCAVTFSATGPATGRWDRLRLEHIIGNLLSNAYKYGAGHPVEVRVETDGPATARLVVRDGGVGIDSDHLDRIFERFERFERLGSPSRFGGLGLGLWIARESATALGGTIRVASVPGAGATFTVELPRGA